MNSRSTSCSLGKDRKTSDMVGKHQVLSGNILVKLAVYTQVKRQIIRHLIWTNILIAFIYKTSLYPRTVELSSIYTEVSTKLFISDSASEYYINTHVHS